jgi:predicted AAA+ superfamily ATPase
MAGGHATHAGIAFQNEVAAWVAVHILAVKPISCINGDDEAIPTSFQLEATSPVDDIVVSTKNGGRLFLNVKTTVSSSRETKSELSKVFDQFVRQWLLGVSEPNFSGGLRRFDARRDRLVLVLRGDRGREFATSFDTVLQRIRDRSQIGPLNEIATTKRQKDIFQNCQELVRFHWSRQLGREIEDVELINVLSASRVTRVTIDGVTGDGLRNLLSQTVTGNESSARQALEALVQIASEYSVRRSGGDARAIREQLRSRKISLIEEPQYQHDINKLEQITTRTLEALAHYGYIAIGGEVGPRRRISLCRPCTNSLVEAAKNKSLLLIGDPGSGKSGTLQAAAQELLRVGHSVLVLAVDQLSASSLDELQVELGLDHPVVDVLAAWHPSTTPILFIDALDASRGGVSERAISQLLRAAMEKAPHWRLVASIRKFDLRYGAKYQGLFVGEPVDAAFSDPEFGNVTHLNIAQLTDDEIAEIGLEWPNLNSILQAGDRSFKKLLRSPFNFRPPDIG